MFDTHIQNRVSVDLTPVVDSLDKLSKASQERGWKSCIAAHDWKELVTFECGCFWSNFHTKIYYETTGWNKKLVVENKLCTHKNRKIILNEFESEAVKFLEKNVDPLEWVLTTAYNSKVHGWTYYSRIALATYDTAQRLVSSVSLQYLENYQTPTHKIISNRVVQIT